MGVLGWLLTCRQAYIEGHDILYRHNTFHLEPHYPSPWPWLDDNISGPAFDAMSSLELVAFHGAGAKRKDKDRNIKHTKDLLEMLPAKFPSLRRLFVHTGPRLYGRRRPTKEKEVKKIGRGFVDDMIPVVDGLARKYACINTESSLRLDIGVPYPVFEPHLACGVMSEKPIQRPYRLRLGEIGALLDRVRMWRNVPALTENVARDDGSGHCGYWLSVTNVNLRYHR